MPKISNFCSLPQINKVIFHDMAQFKALFLKVVKAISSIFLKPFSKVKKNGGKTIFKIRSTVSEVAWSVKQTLPHYNSTIF